MRAACHRRLDCRLCGSQDLADALRLTPTPLANAFVPEARRAAVDAVYPLEVALCGACGHVQLRDVVDPEELYGSYRYVSRTSPSFVRHFERYAVELSSRCRLEKGALVVDVGSNDGTLLGFFRDLGFEVLGIDPARAIAKAATEAGIETLPVFFTADLAERITRERGRCALVTANNVFAHVDDLAGFVRAVRTLLAPHGLFVFEVSYLADVCEQCLFDTIYHEHLDYHSVAPLEAFFARQAMQLIDVERVPTHGGSIRGIAQLAGAARPVCGSIRELIGYERALGLERQSTYAEFARRIEKVKAELGSVLAGLRSEGASIAGYGAPAKATTLMYQLGIGLETVKFIVDDSPYKQGLYTPGMHIPVVPASEIGARAPDVLLILAWNVADDLVKKNETFLRRGGRFVVPLPDVRVIQGP